MSLVFLEAKILHFAVFTAASFASNTYTRSSYGIVVLLANKHQEKKALTSSSFIAKLITKTIQPTGYCTLIHEFDTALSF